MIHDDKSQLDIFLKRNNLGMNCFDLDDKVGSVSIARQNGKLVYGLYTEYVDATDVTYDLGTTTVIVDGKSWSVPGNTRVHKMLIKSVTCNEIEIPAAGFVRGCNKLSGHVSKILATQLLRSLS